MRSRISTSLCLGILLLTARAASAAVADDDYEQSIKQFLLANFAGKNVGMVIALVDERGTRIFAEGSLDNGTDARVDGDTLFEIGSITKTFTSLLVLDMAQRGEVKLDDPVQTYLPGAVRVPALNDKPITLRHLAEQSSGLPFDADNLHPRDPARRFEDYTVDNLYAFLANYTLKQEPGSQYQYSNVGMGLLGHAMSLRAGKDLESLFIERICTPLRMDATRVTLTPQLKARLAVGHDKSDKSVPNYEFQVMAGAGALRSTANDLAKYVSAQLGLSPSPLAPLMEASHVIRHTGAHLGDEPFEGKTATPWYDQGVYQPAGSQLLGHGGGTGGYSTFVGLDLARQRGVVVLSNQREGIHSSMLGWRILQRARLKVENPKAIMAIREIVGLGMALEIDPGHALRVRSVVPNSPAADGGLGAGALVRKINDVPTQDKTLKECLELLHGPAGKHVRLELEPADGDRANPRVCELTTRKFFLDQ